MAEKIDVLKDGSREEQYQNILPQIKASFKTADILAKLAIVSDSPSSSAFI